MAESDDGPNWFWRLCELWGVTWPGHARVKVARGPAPRCGACHNPAKLDEKSGAWKCPYHPDATLIGDAAADRP